MVRAGFFGKLPARGDFVRSGLPLGFLAAWDGWMAGVLAASQASLGARWLEAWLEAPVWRFVLPDGMCGPDAALGLWLPSVDAAGRFYPLMLASTVPGGDPGGMAQKGALWLDAAEACGRAALDEMLPPDTLAACLPPPPPGAAGQAFQSREQAALWWTDGAPRVPARRLTLAAMPNAACFAAMLDATAEHI